MNVRKVLTRIRSNMFTMPFTTFQGKTTVWDWAKNWIITYVFNMAGCLFVAGFLAWWSDVLSLDVQKAYAVTQANGRVNQQWSVNFLRGVGCNLFVSVSLLAILRCTSDGYSHHINSTGIDTRGDVFNTRASNNQQLCLVQVRNLKSRNETQDTNLEAQTSHVVML